MSASSFDRLLATGGTEEVDNSADADHCAVVDWRSDPEETVEAFRSFLPAGFLRYEFPDDDHLLVHTGSRTTSLTLAPRLPAIPLADQLRRLLTPEHGAFLLRSSLGSDTACYVVRPASWWQVFRRDHPDRFALFFTEADHA